MVTIRYPISYQVLYINIRPFAQSDIFKGEYIDISRFNKCMPDLFTQYTKEYTYITFYFLSKPKVE